ncbi:MAG: hypothetical protein QM817_29280 [Archangium sp.]
MKRSILLVAAVATTVFFFNCGTMTGKDGGTGGGTGGGITGGGTTGGGTTGGGTGGGTTGGGTGGGTTGGGTTGGGTGGCTTDDWSQAVNLQAKFVPPGGSGNNNYHQAIIGKPSATNGKFDFMFIELWYGMTVPPFPYAYSLTSSMNYKTCEGCLVIEQACDNMADNCAKEFFATEGSLSYTTGTRVAATGRFEGTGTGIKFVEWNFTPDPDVAATNPACINVATLSWMGRWPASTGDGGTDMDAGTDAGMTTDAGNPDAGDGG